MKKYRLLKDLPTFKAGEIFELWDSIETQGLCRESDGVMAYHQKTLDKFPNILDEWFEEVEEPKNFWFIDEYSPACGVLAKNYNPDFWRYDEYHIDKLEQIGNYFSSKEEAELVVRKLKAWKKLKDKGADFVFIKSQGICGNGCRYRIELCTDTNTLTDEDARADLELLFSRGEE